MVLGFVFWGEGRVMVAECMCFPLLLSYKARRNLDQHCPVELSEMGEM